MNLCTAFGLFIGAWVLIYLLLDLRHGFAKSWWLVLILVVDVAVNVTVRVARARQRHALPPEPGRPGSAGRVQRGPQRHQVG